jgi:hypothetical protein
MLRADLAAAGIEYRDESGWVVDFHGLRHTTASLLAHSGVHPKVAQQIMRHSTVELTLGRYSHVYAGQKSAAVEALPVVDPVFNSVGKTGTYDEKSISSSITFCLQKYPDMANLIERWDSLPESIRKQIIELAEGVPRRDVF